MARKVGKDKQKTETIADPCIGGASWGRHKDYHPKGKIPDILCYRCTNRMGCSRCVENPRELLCLVCHNWATKAALSRHGNIVPNPKVPRVRTDDGWIEYKTGERDITAEVDDLARNTVQASEAARNREEIRRKLMDQARMLLADKKF